MGNWGIGFGFGWLFFIVFWVLIIWAALALTSGISGRGHGYHGRHQEKTALDILKERYAKGEISKADFEEKRKDIEK